jgi:dCMP deaminase
VRHSSDRINKNQYFMNMAIYASERSTCLRRKVGAVLVRDGMVFSTGYNGAPKGLAHCKDVGCIRERMGIKSGERLDLCRAAHAEANAIVQAAMLGASTKGASMYCTLLPCPMCACLVINSGIVKVFYIEGYPESLGYTMLINAGISVMQMERQ